MCQALFLKWKVFSSKLWLKFWLLFGALPDISRLHWYLLNAKPLDLGSHNLALIISCWGSYESLTRMYASWKQRLYLNTLFLACGASINIIHQISANHRRIWDSFRQQASVPQVLGCVFEPMVYVVWCVLTTICYVYSLWVSWCLLVSVRIRKSDFGFTSHYLLVIMLCTKICWAPQN